jgi:hypothetical protein
MATPRKSHIPQNIDITARIGLDWKEGVGVERNGGYSESAKPGMWEDEAGNMDGKSTSWGVIHEKGARRKVGRIG